MATDAQGQPCVPRLPPVLAEGPMLGNLLASPPTMPRRDLAAEQAPWVSFDGFLFEDKVPASTTAAAVRIDKEAAMALLSGMHVPAALTCLGSQSADVHILVRLVFLFRVLNDFREFCDELQFWGIVSRITGLTYPLTRRIVGGYVNARRNYWNQLNATSPLQASATSSSSTPSFNLRGNDGQSNGNAQNSIRHPALFKLNNVLVRLVDDWTPHAVRLRGDKKDRAGALGDDTDTARLETLEDVQLNWEQKGWGAFVAEIQPLIPRTQRLPPLRAVHVGVEACLNPWDRWNRQERWLEYKQQEERQHQRRGTRRPFFFHGITPHADGGVGEAEAKKKRLPPNLGAGSEQQGKTPEAGRPVPVDHHQAIVTALNKRQYAKFRPPLPPAASPTSSASHVTADSNTGKNPTAKEKVMADGDNGTISTKAPAPVPVTDSAREERPQKNNMRVMAQAALARSAVSQTSTKQFRPVSKTGIKRKAETSLHHDLLPSEMRPLYRARRDTENIFSPVSEQQRAAAAMVQLSEGVDMTGHLPTGSKGKKMDE